MVVDPLKFARGRRSMLLPASVVGALVLASFASAEEIRIDAARCSPEVYVAARDAHLSAVLERLAKTLQFDLHFDSTSDPLISVNTHQRVSELLPFLAPSKSMSMTQMRDPRCPSQQRILEVWLLPQGRENPAAAANFATTQPVSTEKGPEQAQLEQAGIDLVLRAHGADPETQAPAR